MPAAVLFDLLVGDARIRPDAEAGWQACAQAHTDAPAQGSVGAGAGATVGKMFGMAHAMKGGIGSASVQLHGVTVGALIAVNALGDVIDPDSGRVVAGARRADDAGRLRDTRRALLAGDVPLAILAGTNTTIGVVATDMRLDKAQAQRLAVAAHDGLARSICPVHTQSDGDTLFALATGQTDARVGASVLGLMAVEAVTRATLRAVLAARPLSVDGLTLPAARDLAL